MRARPKCRSSWRSTRSTRAMPIRSRSGTTCRSTTCCPRNGAATRMFVNVSARTGQGIDELLDTILLQADVLELKAAVDGLAAGVVIESSMEKGRGAVATVLVKRGTLKPGDPIIAGQEFGRVRAMFDENGQPVTEAGPSLPVVVLGLSAAPNAGDELLVGRKRAQGARSRAVSPGQVPRHASSRSRARRSWKTCCRRWAMARPRPCRWSSRRTCRAAPRRCATALSKLSTDEVAVKVVSSGVGGITESDVTLAMASNARIIGFNVRADSSARSDDQGIRHRRALLQHHLRSDRRREGDAVGHARAGGQGADRRARGGARGVPLQQVRHGCGLHRDGRLRAP